MTVLAEMLRAIESKCDVSLTTAAGLARGESSIRIATGWDEIDAALGGGLPIGLHEWFGLPVCGVPLGACHPVFSGCHAPPSRGACETASDAQAARERVDVVSHAHMLAFEGKHGTQGDPRVPLRPLRGLHSTRGYDPPLLRSDSDPNTTSGANATSGGSATSGANATSGTNTTSGGNNPGCHCSVSSANTSEPKRIAGCHAPPSRGACETASDDQAARERAGGISRARMLAFEGKHGTRKYRSTSTCRGMPTLGVGMAPESANKNPPKQTRGRVHADSSRETGHSERTSPFSQRRGHRPPARRQPWLAPLCVFAHLAWRALEADPLSRRIAWIGSRCTPYPRMLVRAAHGDARLLSQSLFVQAPNRAARLWAADLALRSNAVGCVLVDGSGFDTAATRRLHLLAKTHGKLVLSARPVAERSALSSAVTRWLVRPSAAEADASRRGVRPRWNVSLIRCKTTAHDGELDWLLEWKHGESALDLSRPLARPAGATETAAANTHGRSAQVACG